jgi:predicted ATPase
MDIIGRKRTSDLCKIDRFSGWVFRGCRLPGDGTAYAVLAALVEKSLIQMGASGGYGIHELLRQYGMEKLESYGETNEIHDRHSRYFAQQMLQYEAALKQPQQLEAMQDMENNFENIRLAWEWSSKNQQTTQLDMMLNGLYLFGFLRSLY